MLILLFSCSKEQVKPDQHFPALMEVPEGFPEVQHPEGNAFTLARWELGKRLFYDPVMSVDSSISCASCHLSNLAFSDSRALSPGVEQRPGKRNAPALANVTYHPYYTREGGVPTLEMQILVPIQEHNEFDFNIVLLAERLLQDTSYVLQSQEAYGRNPDPFVITRSLACFERSLLSGNSKYDAYLRKQESMTEDEIAGMSLFFSERTACSHCHDGFNFTNYAIENNGLYESYNDPGKARLTNKETDIGKFKVPSLRNVAVTAPYMHDGSLASLEAVIAHYNEGGQLHPNKSELIQPLLLSEKEQHQLVLFLNTLTDELFINNPLFKKDN